MKNTFLLLALIFTMCNVFAQPEKDICKEVSDKFQSKFNQGQYDSIFVMFSNEMQTALPVDKTVDFLTATKKQLGQIIRKEFIRYDKTFAVYKTYFQNGLFNINISVDKNSKINGFSFTPYELDNIIKIERNKTHLSLPFKGSWNVTWGGDIKELNYHVENKTQKNAFDFLIIDSTGKSYKTDGKTNEDYYAFGKEILAPCDGVVVLSVNGIKDNIPVR